MFLRGGRSIEVSGKQEFIEHETEVFKEWDSLRDIDEER